MRFYGDENWAVTTVTEKGQLVNSSAKSLHTSVKHISRMNWEYAISFCLCGMKVSVFEFPTR